MGRIKIKLGVFLLLVTVLFFLFMLIANAEGAGEGPAPDTGDDLSCFPAGTKITMSDNSLKNIEDVKIGDEILAFDVEAQEKKPAEVIEIESPIREGYYKLNENLLRVTDEHPIFARKPDGTTGWASINPEKTHKETPLPMMNLEVDDEIFTVDKVWVKIKSMEYVKGKIQTYNLKTVERYNTFYADGVLVHNKIPPGCVCSSGQSETGGGCGTCGTLRRDCDGCNWGPWYCSGDTNCQGSCGACGSCADSRYRWCTGGQYGSGQCIQDCNACVCCSPDQGKRCGYCGTIDCAGNCVNQGVCSPGSTSCSGTTRRTCTSSCTWSNTEDCATKLSTDTDGSATAYTIAGTVRDYTTCSGGNCVFNNYNDVCSGTRINERGASGASLVTNTYECQNYESNYCSANRYYRNEWSCGFGPPSRCYDAPDTRIGTNSDGDAKDLQCGDSLCDNSPNVYDSTRTANEVGLCADGLDNDCDQRTDCADTDCAGASGPGGVRCCQTPANCIQDDCVIEQCNSYNCAYVNRAQCDATECAPNSPVGTGTYCDASGGNCASADASSAVCLNCAPDQTAATWTPTDHQDNGKGWSANTDVYNTLFNSDNGPCSAGSGGPCFDANNNPVNHESAMGSGRCCGDDASEYYKPDYYAGECADNVNECVWSTGDSQSSNTGNAKWWCYLHEWNDCDTANDISKRFGGVCCAGTVASYAWTPNSLVRTENQYSCTDGIDNDCDALIDCNDNDCDGVISGTVTNQNKGISSADIIAKKDLTTVKSAATNQLGTYSMGINCGTYNLVASHPDYAPSTKTNINVAPNQQVTADFSLTLGTSCEADCTFAADDIVHASCDGKNGCTFYDDIAKSACDFAQPGWVRDYNETHYVICASGSPQLKVEIEASVTCSSGTLVKVTRIVVYNGKPVKLVVAACG